ncbi:MAG: DUF4397 domain-containing protein [Pedobacter sp.]|nr:MAG: DUF4397 domain-containing protein [Pedobacter sp.]
MKKLLYIILACSVSFAACEKGTLVETTEYEKVALGDPKYSYLKILNVTPGSPFINYYVDGAKFSSALSSSGVENSGYNYATATSLYPDFGYATTAPGARKLTAKTIPSLTIDANLEVLNTTITPVAGKYYTLFTSGVYSATNKSVGPILMIEDIRPALDTAKIFLRFVNMYSGSPNLDLVKTSTMSKIATNVAYGAASKFAEIPMPGNGIAPVNALALYDSLTGVALTSSANFTFTKGRAYTIYIRGVLGNTTYPLTTGSYTTFQY